ncbi:hypothetical protein [Streptomyces niveus]|uniref:Uncharacterized protein n=1 Tax=Streptomyces niveus TaxID=193462 RepID=A0ABZ2AAU6_STRNV|nr:hypothetical protein [Streptomyces niveus]WTA58320.1 hypothetical protein OG211_07385 [Streptomyces niveus]
MHTDVHLQLHALRAAELRTEAAEFRLSRAGAPGPGRLRGLLGWFLVDLGLRLVHRPHVHAARIA